jgi:murein DD-endopeptidase MepM/ murein hydrolase activator NlpD
VGIVLGGAVTAWWAASAVGNTPSAKAENVLLRSRLSALEARLGRVDRALARVASYDAKIRQLTQEDRGARAFGIGPLSELEVAAAERERRTVALPGGELPPAPNKDNLLGVLDDLDQRARDLEERALREEVSLQEIRGYLDDRTSLINAYPSEWPVRGWVTSRYGWRTGPHSGARRLHTGIDIAAPRGTPIVAAADGHVVFAGYHSAYGNLVVVDHGYGITTKHAHTSRILVAVGDRVLRGDVIARVGNTGRSTGPHLHFELLQDGVPVNPLPFLRSE